MDRFVIIVGSIIFGVTLLFTDVTCGVISEQRTILGTTRDVDGLNPERCGSTNYKDWTSTNAFCGGSQRTSTRMAGGIKTTLGRFPSYVTLTIQFGRFASFSKVCGGTLIHNDLVVTAAHCLFITGSAYADLQLRSVRIDAIEERNSNGTYRNQTRFGKVYCNHPFYRRLDEPRKDLHIYDLTLIQVDVPFVYSEKLKPACIVQESHSKETECYSVGTGIDGSTKDASNLMYLPMKRGCASGSNGKNYIQLSNAALGATCYNSTSGGNGCAGDDGGPMFCMDSCRGLKQYLVGVTSISLNVEGTSCGLRGEHAVIFTADLYKMKEMMKFLVQQCHEP